MKTVVEKQTENTLNKSSNELMNLIESKHMSPTETKSLTRRMSLKYKISNNEDENNNEDLFADDQSTPHYSENSNDESSFCSLTDSDNEGDEGKNKLVKRIMSMKSS
jgi:hypothetical protein